MKRNVRNDSYLKEQLYGSVDAYDNVADGPLVAPTSGNFTLGSGRSNPSFVAQFDINIQLLYFTVAVGAYTNVAAATIAANLRTQLGAFVFGNSDFAGGFKNLIETFGLSVWAYGVPFIFGKQQGYTPFGDLDATAEAFLQKGDLVIPQYASSGGTDYVALAVVRCKQVGYGTLLDSLNSDIIKINKIRYVVANADIAQFNQNIRVIKQTLFGRTNSDNVSPTSFKNPEQQQDGITDIPITETIDKQIAFATFVNYNVVNVDWSIFVAAINKR